VNAKWLALGIAAACLLPRAVRAGATIKIDDDIKLDLGLRLQTWFFYSETDRDGTGHYSGQKDFLIRRARVRLRGDVTKYVSAFLQTDVEEQAGTSFDMRVIDAYVLFKGDKLLNLYVGENMVAAIRQEVSSSATHMALDRPGLAYKSLSWGARAKYLFTNNTLSDSNSQLLTGTRASVRDLGATLFGSGSLTPMVHFKYYAGLYDGVQLAARDNFRFTVRGQVNFFDAEPNYYNDSTYLGTKRTIGIGASYDGQNAVAFDQATRKQVDYRLYSLDAFAEQPIGPGSVTAEFGWVNLDLGGGGTMIRANNTTLGNASRTQGHGWFAQAGFYVTALKLQPWVNFERWISDGAGNRGWYKAYRAGLNYYLKGENANVKAGIEVFQPDSGFSAFQDKITSFVLALNTNY
jgi:hypothetical protein